MVRPAWNYRSHSGTAAVDVPAVVVVVVAAAASLARTVKHFPSCSSGVRAVAGRPERRLVARARQSPRLELYPAHRHHPAVLARVRDRDPAALAGLAVASRMATNLYSVHPKRRGGMGTARQTY